MIRVFPSNSMRDPWKEPGALATVVLLPIATALSVFVVYGRWGDIGIGDVFWFDIRGFPWLRMSVALTIATGIAGVAGAHRRLGGGILSSAGTYALVVVPLLLLLFYPGPAALNRSSDGNLLYLILLLAFVHGVGFARIRSAVERAERPE